MRWSKKAAPLFRQATMVVRKDEMPPSSLNLWGRFFSTNRQSFINFVDDKALQLAFAINEPHDGQKRG
jgi:hypothetical protein